MAPKEVDKLITFEVAKLITLKRPKDGQTNTSPAYIYIYIDMPFTCFFRRKNRYRLASVKCVFLLYPCGCLLSWPFGPHSTLSLSLLFVFFMFCFDLLFCFDLFICFDLFFCSDVVFCSDVLFVLMCNFILICFCMVLNLLRE